jgi:hypothetical protein
LARRFLARALRLAGSDGVLRREALDLDLLGLFKTLQQLVNGQALCPAAEAVTLQLLDDLTQPLVLGALRRKHRLKRDRIVGLRLGRVAHKADSIMYSNALPAPLAAHGINLPRPARASRGRHASGGARDLNVSHWIGRTPEPIAGVASIVDGDTIEIHGQRIRFNGINAPESRQYWDDGKGFESLRPPFRRNPRQIPGCLQACAMLIRHIGPLWALRRQLRAS